MEFLFAPFAFAISFPGIILLPAVVFAAAWWFLGGSRLVLVTHEPKSLLAVTLAA